VILSPPATETAAETAAGLALRELIGLAVLGRIREAECLTRPQMASWHSSRQVLQARRWHRMLFEHPLELTPLDPRTEEPCGDTIDVLGRDVSLGGISFLHPRPLACLKGAISFPPANEDEDVPPVIVRLTWCRFTARGIYQSGGPFVRVLDAVPLVPDER
jgi:hypothetical protein